MSFSGVASSAGNRAADELPRRPMALESRTLLVLARTMEALRALVLPASAR